MSKDGNEKIKRQQRIIELVGQGKVQTQLQLLGILCAEGFKATQATISRDIRELRLAKTTVGDRSFRYTKPVRINGSYDANQTQKQIKTLKETVLGLSMVKNLVVISCSIGGS